MNTELPGIGFAVKYFLLKSSEQVLSSWLCIREISEELKKKKNTSFSTYHALGSLNFLCTDHLIHLTEAGFWALELV